MRREWKLYLILTLLLSAIVALIVLSRQLSPPPSIASPSPSASPAVQGVTACRSAGGLPDPSCTPGEVDPAVTQENIHATICVSGYTARVRPPVDYTNELKREQIALYGYTDTDPRLYEEDHLIPLELGGAPSDPKNLWPEPGGSPNEKDRIENDCRKKVCSGLLLLSVAQREIAADWHTACQ